MKEEDTNDDIEMIDESVSPKKGNLDQTEDYPICLVKDNQTSLSDSDEESSQVIEQPQQQADITLSYAFKTISLKSISAMTSCLICTLIEAINLVYIGRLNDPVSLGVVGLSATLINCVNNTFVSGINGAFDTLVSQAYGKKEYYLWGCYFNRCIIIQLIFFVVQSIILGFSKHICLFFGQDYNRSVLVQEFIMWMLPGILSFTFFKTIRRYIQCLDDFNTALWIQGFTSIFHWGWLWLFMFYFDLGVKGWALATFVTHTLSVSFLCLYIFWKKDEVMMKTFHFINKDSFRGWNVYFRYAVPSMMLLAIVWWNKEIIAFFAGTLGTDQLAANVVLLNLNTFLFNIPSGILYASITFVGKSIGANKPENAKAFSTASFILVLLAAVILGGSLFIFKDLIPLIYTSDEETIHNINQIYMLFLAAMFFDWMQGVLAGSIKALGFQISASVISFVTLWVLRLPLMYVLMFPAKLGIVGLWLATTSGILLQAIWYTVFIFNVDFHKIALEAQSRLKRK